MTFRRRLTLAATVAVAIAVALASVGAWLVVRGQLRGEIDEELRARAERLRGVPFIRVVDGAIELPAFLLGQRVGITQIEAPGGRMFRAGGGPGAIRVPGSTAPGFFDLEVNGTHYRAYREPIGEFTLTLALPLTDVDESLRRLAFVLLFLTGGGVALAVLLGGGVTAAAAAPVARLPEATERVTETGDLSLRIEDADGDDELGRLASSFNGMLAALEASVKTQKQLVADASHELRTPLTSIRTNVDLLASGAELDPDDRRRLLGDVRAQLEELTTVVADLVELARDGERPPGLGDVRLDEVVAASVEAFRRHAGDVEIVTDLELSVVVGDGSRIDRAVRNLLDNAVSWSPPGGRVEVGVRNGVVTVRDQGPGFAEEDLPHVFDRFYRSRAARAKPGSGLGLAIVRQVAVLHGGRVGAENALDGGAVVRLELPVAGDEAPTELPAPPEA
ncbi:MAG TPA: HAMP domain-containing sensor histidine kinase [Actinomycetota bacterium]|nr:HAMP domain-containing sensor histidine kinase [Actinomycetota bacterium]